MKIVKQGLSLVMMISLIFVSLPVMPMHVHAEDTVEYQFHIVAKEYSGDVTFTLYVDDVQSGSPKSGTSSVSFDVPVGGNIRISCDLSRDAYQSFISTTEVVEADKHFDVKICGHEGNNRTTKVLKEATASQKGQKATYCTTCNQQLSVEELPMLACAHTFTELITVVSATEKTPGSANKVCTECKEVIEVVELELLPHIHDIQTIVIEPTCTREGYTLKKCSGEGCGYNEKINYTEKKEHSVDNTATETVAATCTTAGYKINQCSTCNHEVYTVLPVEHSYNYGTITKEATCSEEGIRTRTCTGCGAQTEVSVTKTAHKWSSDYRITKEATCTENGEKIRYCTVCNETLSTSTIFKTGHTASLEYVVTKEATCTENGVKVQYCTVCNEIARTATVYKLGHTKSSEYVVTKEATCTENGEKVQYCTVCNEVVYTSTIYRLGHTNSSEYVVTKEATCYEMGEKSRYCTICNEVVSTLDVSKLSHTWSSEYLITKEATCAEMGEKIRYCTVCNELDVLSIAKSNDHKNLTEEVTVKPTATSTGVKTITCEDCGYTTTEVLDMVCEHANRGTREIEGVKYWYCKDCYETLEIYVPTPETCHHASYAQTERLEVAATETTDGQVSKLCDGCGTVMSTHVIPAHKAYTVDIGNGETATVYGYFETEMSEEVFELLNEYRRENGLNTLAYASFIQEEADIRAIEAAYSFSHTRPNGTKWYTLNEELMNGENLASGYKTAETVMVAWENSPTHNANLLHNAYKSIAISTFHGLTFIDTSFIPTKCVLCVQTFSCYESIE